VPNFVFNHIYIFMMLLFGIYSQLIMRWQVGLAGPLPECFEGKIYFVVRLLLTPWVISAVLATFFAGVSWMLALTKFEISYAYPWVSLNFIFILLADVLFFGEKFSSAKCLGTVLIIAGIVVLARR